MDDITIFLIGFAVGSVYASIMVAYVLPWIKKKHVEG